MDLVLPSSLLVVLSFLLLGIHLLIGILALIDIIKSDFKGNDKIIWIVVILVLWFFGAILYYFIGRKQKIRP